MLENFKKKFTLISSNKSFYNDFGKFIELIVKVISRKQMCIVDAFILRKIGLGKEFNRVRKQMIEDYP